MNRALSDQLHTLAQPLNTLAIVMELCRESSIGEEDAAVLRRECDRALSAFEQLRTYLETTFAPEPGELSCR